MPVDFQLLSPAGAPLDPEIRTAFTRDLCMGGLCLEVHSLPPGLATRVAEQPTTLGINVDIELPGRALRLSGRVAWRREITVGRKQVLLLGVEFKELAEEDGAEIDAFALRAARRPRIVRAVVAGLSALLLLGGGYYLWRVDAYERVLAATHETLAKAEGRAESTNDRLGDMQVELRWLAVRARELVQTLDDGRDEDASGGPASDPASQVTRPVVDEIADSLERLSVLINTECKTKE